MKTDILKYTVVLCLCSVALRAAVTTATVKSGTHTTSVTITHVVPGVPPSGTGTPPPAPPDGVNLGALNLDSVTLRWNPALASTGRTIARYDIYLNGLKVGSTTATEFTASFDTSGAMLQFFSIVAVDDQGNASAASQELEVLSTIEVPVSLQVKRGDIFQRKRGVLGYAGSKRRYTHLVGTERGRHDVYHFENGAIAFYENEYTFANDLTITQDIDVVTGQVTTSATGRHVFVWPAQSITEEGDYYYSPPSLSVSSTPPGQHYFLNYNVGFYGKLPNALNSAALSSRGGVQTATNWHWASLDSRIEPGVYNWVIDQWKDITLSNEDTNEAVQSRAASLESRIDSLLVSSNWNTAISSDGERDLVNSFLPSAYDFIASTFNSTSIEFGPGGGPATGYVSLERISRYWSYYRFVTSQKGFLNVRWLEILDDYESAGPVVIAERHARILGGDLGAETSTFKISPPALPEADVYVFVVPDGFKLDTPSIHPAVGRPRLYQADALFTGESVILDVGPNPFIPSNQVLADAISLSESWRGDTVKLDIGGTPGVIRVYAVDPAVVSSTGMEAAIALGAEIVSGTDILPLVRPASGTARTLVAVGSIAGESTIIFRLKNFYYSFDVIKQIKVYPLPELAVDNNRKDGIKLASEDASDATTAARPYRFWINDDNDMDGAEGLNDSGGNDIPGQIQNFSSGINESRGLGADHSTSVEGAGFVDGVRDLIDFFPVYLDLKQLLMVLPRSASVKYKLKQADGALNFVYTNKKRGQAFDHQRQLLTTGFSDLFDKQPGEAITHRISAEGHELSEAFLTGITDNDGGVILVEGRATTTSPLILVVEKDGGAIIKVKLEIKISPVEQMFRHVNLTGSATNYNGSTLTLPVSAQPTTTEEPPGWSDSHTNGKYFVFVHGYNVNGQKARGWNSEVFKRMHVLGSNARFVGVTWHGATGLDYHKAVYQAFQTGDALNAALSFTGSADVTIAAHSLGNMVVSHAIQSRGYSPSRYYMINSAVPIEAYDLSNVDAAQRTAMIEDDWKSRDVRFYAANWHELFAATPADHRNKLSWKNRFHDVLARAYNFYSPGEDVVENATTDTAAVAVTILNQGFNFSKGAWKAQELVKGVTWTTSLAALFMERGQGGWDSDLAYLFTSHASITNEQLKTRPFFDEFKEDDLIHTDPAIASAKAAEPKVQYDLLARGLPALSYAAAANRLSALDLFPQTRNFDMEAEGRTSGQWPTEGHSGGNAGKWLHSDFKNAALPYVYQMYEAMIAKGSLK